MANPIKGGSRRPNPRLVTDGGATIGHNKTPEQITKERKEREDAEAIQLLSIISRGKAQLAKVAIKKAELKAEQDAFSDICRNAKTAIKIARSQIIELITDSNPEGRRAVNEEEQKRARWRRAMGLPVGLSETERELEERLPDVERDGMFWRAAGYTSGLTGEFCTPPAECVGGGFDNLYAEGHKDGHAAFNKNTKLLQPKPRGAAPKKDEPNPLDDPASPESLKANAGAEARARASLDAMGKDSKRTDAPEPGGPDDLSYHYGEEDCTGCGNSPGFKHGDNCPVMAANIKAKGGDFVEATEDELKAQAGRPSVVAGKAAAETAAEGGEPEAVG